MKGKWDRWFTGLEDPEPFGLSITYDLAYEWLKDCETVEDWGCGKGWFSQYFDGGYRGVDGSQTPFADVIVDLAEYRSKPDGILLRHVLEHNFAWTEVLDNAVWSAQKRLVIVLFTPLAEWTQVIVLATEAIAPDISFRLGDITDRLTGFTLNIETLETATQYGVETVITAERA